MLRNPKAEADNEAPTDACEVYIIMLTYVRTTSMHNRTLPDASNSDCPKSGHDHHGDTSTWDFSTTRGACITCSGPMMQLLQHAPALITDFLTQGT